MITACSLDSQFLRPQKFSQDKSSITINNDLDSLVITFSKDRYQPTFSKEENIFFPYKINYESTVFHSQSGNKLHGWMLTPKEVQRNGITLLHFHGNAGSVLSQLGTIAPMVEKGYRVFMFDYSGFGFSTGDASRDNVLLDGYSGLEYLLTREDIKGDKIVVYGQSLGGHLSAVVATNQQNAIDGLVIEGAFSSHKDIAAEAAGFLGRIFVAEKYSAKESIVNFRKPLLIVHSREDRIIPLKMGKLLFERANTAKVFLEIDKSHLAGPKYSSDKIDKAIRKLVN
jgi:pimeloyl-ACP methyl ester carboxylesterase